MEKKCIKSKKKQILSPLKAAEPQDSASVFSVQCLRTCKKIPHHLRKWTFYHFPIKSNAAAHLKTQTQRNKNQHKQLFLPHETASQRMPDWQNYRLDLTWSLCSKQPWLDLTWTIQSEQFGPSTSTECMHGESDRSNLSKTVARARAAPGRVERPHCSAFRRASPGHEWARRRIFTFSWFTEAESEYQLFVNVHII